MKKDLLTLRDLSADDCEALFKRSFELKERHAAGIADLTFQGKTLGLIFDKPSTRTRVSFEAAMVQLGGRYRPCALKISGWFGGTDLFSGLT